MSQRMNPLWDAILNRSSPRYAYLKAAFGEDRIPLESPSEHAAYAPGKTGKFYRVAVRDLRQDQVDRIVTSLSARFSLDRADVVRDLFGGHGLPIPAEDVIVAFSTRAFM